MYLDIRSQFKQGTTTTTVLTGSKVQVIDGYYPADGTDDTTPVVDTFDIWLNGSETENQAKLAEIRMALESAKKYKDTQRRAFIRFSPYTDSIDDVWQSRIISGRVVHGPKMIKQLKRERMKLTLVIERDPWWEYATGAYIPLTNGNGTDVTGGSVIRVYNCGDNATVDTSYKRDNWVTIDGVNDVEGDLPAPIVMYYTIPALDVNIRTIHAFNNVNAYPSSLDSLIEAEEYGADTSLTGASAGYVGQFSIGSGSDVLWWTLDIDDQVEYSGSGYFIAFLRFKYDQITNLDDLKFKVQLYESTQGVFYESDYFYPTSETGEPVYAISPAFKLRPQEIFWSAANVPDGYTLRLYAYQETGGSITLVMDDIHLLPVEEYRKLGDEGYDIGDSMTVLDTGDDQLSIKYTVSGPDNLTFPVNHLGQLFVHPGVNQKITFIYGMTTADNQTKINSTYTSISALYRARRRTI